MFITGRYLRRRTFLRGMGVSLALPFLDAMVPALSAFTKTAARGTARLAFMYIPNGAVIDKDSHGYDAWTPTIADGDLNLSPILQPLAPVRDRLVVLSGLNQPMA